jgi:uncharacterized protein (DUF433 family)
MPAVVYAHIDLAADGVPMISGTTMKVVELVAEHLAWNWDAGQLQAQHPYLSLGQIHSALAYFHDHEDELRADLERREHLAESMLARVGTTAVGAKLRSLRHGS